MAIPWGAIGSVVGNVAGSLLGDDGGDEAKRNRRFQYAVLTNQIQWRVNDAIKAGLHPLAALGISPASVGNVYPTGEKDWSRAGQELGAAIGGMYDPQQKKLRALQLEQEYEKLKRFKLENMGLLKELNELDRPPVVPVGADPVATKLGIIGQTKNVPQANKSLDNLGVPGQSPAGVEFTNVQIPYSQKKGAEVGVGPGRRWTINPDGSVNELPSTADQEALESSIFLQVQDMLSRGHRYLKGHGALFLRNNKLFNEIREWRPADPPKGYEFRYNHWSGKYVLRKLGSFGVRSSLFDEGYRPDVPN